MTTPTDELSLTTSRHVNASPKTLYDAWLDPRMLVQFMIAGQGMSCPRAQTDPKVGGRYEIIMNDGSKDIPHTGEYLVLEPHSRIAFTWFSPFAEHGTEVQISFTPEDGGTLVELTHLKFRTEDSRNGHKMGWNAILDQLQHEYA